jgi:hypothetical protein
MCAREILHISRLAYFAVLSFTVAHTYYAQLGDSSMTQLSAIEALQQQLAQLEELTEGQVNELLQKLESQKARLPVEDRSIIDWGIGVIRARAQEEEAWAVIVRREFSHYESREAFFGRVGWRDLKGLTGRGLKEQLEPLLKKELDDIFVSVSVVAGKDELILTYVPRFKEHLETLYVDDASEETALFSRLTQGMGKSPYRKTIEACIAYVQENAQQTSSPSHPYHGRSHYYQLIGKVLNN